MNIQFYDREDSGNPRNGETFSNERELVALLDELRSREPFFCELVGSNNQNLLVGIGADIGCAQYSAGDGAPPYVMAVDRDSASSDDGYEEFLAGGTLTPVQRRYCLPMDMLKQVVASFVECGGKSSLVDWEEI